jgi:hypothetical protein
MKASEGTKDENAVTGEVKQDNDASLNEVGTPDLPGEGSDIANESMSWDMTKTQESVDQVLKVYPNKTSDKARTLLEMVYDDLVDDSETCQIAAVNAALTTAFGDPKHAKTQGAGGKPLDIFLPLLTDFRAEARAWKKEQPVALA